MRRRRRRLDAIGFLAAATSVMAPMAQSKQQQGLMRMLPQESGTSALLISVSPRNSDIVWVAGQRGTFVRTIDGGATWVAGQVAGAESLEFRDVHAVSASTAYLLSIGNGPRSRIYKTTNGGQSWTLQFTNRDSAAFFDCFGFWNENEGIAVGDAIGDQIVMVRTVDGGRNWVHIPPTQLPPAIPGEGSFASSGTCLVTARGGRAWIGTTKGRVLRTSDKGKSWQISLTPITVSDSTGVASLAFRNGSNGMAFGGYGATPSDVLVAVTGNSGKSWTARARPPIKGGIWAGAYVPGAPKPSVVVVGRTGAAYSLDDARTWAPLDSGNYWGVAFADRQAGWAVGANGRIVKLGLY